MNNFEALYQSVMKNELGYNPNDQGHETYNGIWRGAWPGWAGWKIIDKIPNKKRGQTFYKTHPQLEQLAKDFYAVYWKPVQVNAINDLRMAQLLVDMATQHGGWKKIVYAGLYNTDPLPEKPKIAKQDYTQKEFDLINKDTAAAYSAIAAKRLYYCKYVPLKNEGDRRGIINRAMKYVNIAKKWVTENPGTASGTAMILLLVGFFFLTDND